jgi:hypothetical protein
MYFSERDVMILIGLSLLFGIIEEKYLFISAPTSSSRVDMILDEAFIIRSFSSEDDGHERDLEFEM